MEKIEVRKKKKTRNNKKNKNKNRNQTKEVGNKSNDQKESLQKGNLSEKVQSVPMNVASSSPRPNTLLKGNCENVVKRSSGSEYEDFQTPSIEYDIKTDYCAEINEDYYNHSYDKEWDDIGSFQSTNLENIDEQDLKVQRDRTRIIVTKTTCWNNVDDESPIIDQCEITVQEHQELDLKENNHLVEHQEELDGVISKEDDNINDENCIMCVNQFFEDLDDECYKYPLKEKIEKTPEWNFDEKDDTHHHQTSQEVAEPILSDKDEDEAMEEPNITTELYQVQYLDKVVLEREEQIEDQIPSDDAMDLLCTEENLNEETLLVKCIKLDVKNETPEPRSMTLRPRTMESTFKESEESSKNVISRSDDNIPLNVKKERVTKKNKFTETTLYQKLFKRFRKEKSIETEEIKHESFEHNLSLKSGEIVKDSEIESNQSLISNNDFENTSQTFSPTVEIESPKRIITEEVVENCVGLQSNTEPPLTKMRTKANKKERPRSFMDILKKKHKIKKDPEPITVTESPQEKKESEVLGLTQLEKKEPEMVDQLEREKTEDPVLRKPEIEKEVIDEFNEALKSLMDSDIENREDETVFVKESIEDTLTNHVVNNEMTIGPADNEDNDYLFPDAVTATKIFGFKSKDVPYIDDAIVTQSDSKSFYNGESKRFRISPEFFVPMASMESLYFPDDSITNNAFQKSLLSQSPCKRKRVFGNFLGYMGRGR